MVKIRISPTIADEYMTRGVYDFIGNAGTYTLTLEQAKELRVYDFARAYSSLASKLIEVIGL